MNNNNQNQQQNNWQQPVNGQNFTHNMPQQQPGQPVQNMGQQPAQNMQQPVWNNQQQNLNQQAFGGQTNAPNAQGFNGQSRQQGAYQNYQGQQFQQAQPNQQFNRGNVNQQYQQSENMNFHQNQQGFYGQTKKPSTMSKLMDKKYSALFLTTLILAGLATLYNLSMKGFSEDLRWFLDSAWLSTATAEIYAEASLLFAAVGVLTFLGWLKGNKWLVLSALIVCVFPIFIYCYVAIAMVVLLLIIFVGMIKDGKKRKNLY